MVRNLLFVLALAGALALAGCSKDDLHPSTTLTEHQRDSVLAKSQLPGAFVVGRALAVSEKTENRAAALDSLSR